ncbi:hypothetical protein Tco_0726438 [Tanacetum coccineum]|uniref:Uncharacterized protein n=1 Tax=Tanacetum coccineum TaxID=301880 RepID=A0ABQ4YI46_9ASTR
MEKELHNRMGKSGWLLIGTRYSKGAPRKSDKAAKAGVKARIASSRMSIMLAQLVALKLLNYALYAARAGPILVYMSEVDGKFNFSPVSVNFRTEVAKVSSPAFDSRINNLQLTTNRPLPILATVNKNEKRKLQWLSSVHNGIPQVDEQAGNSQKNRYVTGAFCNGVINVKDAVERQHINEAEADI